MSNPNGDDYGTSGGSISNEKLKELQKKGQSARAKSNGQAQPSAAKRGRPALSAEFSDARMAEYMAREVLASRYLYTRGQGWMEWNGVVWSVCGDHTVVESIRQHAVTMYEDAKRVADKEREDNGKTSVASRAKEAGWKSMLGYGRRTTVLKDCRGICDVDDAAFDADPEILNTPGGILSLRDGSLRPHEPTDYVTKVTGARYRKPTKHGAAVWKKVLEAIPADTRPWMAERVGQALTGYMTPDDVLLVCQGSGENGKSTFFDGVTRAAGSYAVLVSDKVLLAASDAHDTEVTDLKGARIALIEESPEARRLSVARLKKIIGTPTMKARKIRQDTMEWRATHSVFLNTNYRPLITETDHGTWRRLLLMRFPYRFVEGAPSHKGERSGDAALRHAVSTDSEVWEAALYWAVQGSMQHLENGRVFGAVAPGVRRDTDEWRGETDEIASFAESMLEPDSGAVVAMPDLIAQFTLFRGESVTAWSPALFRERFLGHDYFAENGCELMPRTGISRFKKSGTLSRPATDSGEPLPAKCPVVTGIRWKRASSSR